MSKDTILNLQGQTILDQASSGKRNAAGRKLLSGAAATAAQKVWASAYMFCSSTNIKVSESSFKYVLHLI